MNPGDVLAALTWRDVIDFVLLYAVAYAVLRVLKGTRAVPVLVSVALLAAAAFVAGELDFVGISVLLRYLLQYIIIILIVVFHQELRRLLVRMGQRLLPQARREAAESGVEALVAACDRLVKARVGALFILEGEFEVLQICSHVGKRIDAQHGSRRRWECYQGCQAAARFPSLSAIRCWRGTVNRKMDPDPGALSAPMCPPISSTS